MKLIHIFLFIFLSNSVVIAQKKPTTNSKKKQVIKHDTSYFFGEWNMYSYTISKTGDTTFLHYTSESNGNYDKNGYIPNADPVGIVKSNDNDSLIDIYWIYEKGMIISKFIKPDILLFMSWDQDEQVKWDTYKVDFISENEFIIHNWRWENCTNRFVRRGKK